MLKALLLKIAQKLFSMPMISHSIALGLEQYNVRKYSSKLLLGEKSSLYFGARVENLSGDKNKIKIGCNTHVRGELLVLPYSEGLVVGSNCYIGERSVIRAYKKILIGDNVLIAHNVTIIDSDSHEINYLERAEGFRDIFISGHVERHKIKSEQITIRDNAWLSYNVSVLKGVEIGEGAIVGAGAVVTKDVPPFTVVAGNPAKVIKNLACGI